MNLQNLLNYDSTILDGVTVPAPLSKELTQSAIMIRCGLLTPVYSEPETMKAAVNFFFASRQWEFLHLLKIIQAEYSPIENTDRYDNWTRTIDRQKSGSTSNQEDTTGSRSGSMTGETGGTLRSETTGESLTESEKTTTGSRTETESDVLHREDQGTSTASSTAEHTVSAFNSSTYQPDSKDTASSNGSDTSETDQTTTINKSGSDNGSESGSVTGSESGSRTDTTTGTATETTTGSETGRKTASGTSAEDEDSTETYTQHLHGNIGVTTNQQMITEEITLVKMFNVYDTIAAMFETEFCLGVY